MREFSENFVSMYGAAFSSSNEEVVAVVGSAAIASGAISLSASPGANLTFSYTSYSKVRKFHFPPRA